MEGRTQKRAFLARTIFLVLDLRWQQNLFREKSGGHSEHIFFEFALPLLLFSFSILYSLHDDDDVSWPPVCNKTIDAAILTWRQTANSIVKEYDYAVNTDRADDLGLGN